MSFRGYEVLMEFIDFDVTFANDMDQTIKRIHGKLSEDIKKKTTNKQRMTTIKPRTEQQKILEYTYYYTYNNIRSSE